MLLSDPPTDRIQPKLLIAFNLWDFHKVDANDVVESIRSGNCRWSLSLRRTMSLAIVAMHVLGYPSGDVRSSISELDHPCEISVGRMSAIVVGNLEVFDLLRSRSEVFIDFLRVVILVCRVRVGVFSDSFFRQRQLRV